jgi:hypothetical protein
MEAQQPLAQGWAIAALVTLLPVGLYLFFKMFTAKTRKAHWGYFALTMLLGTILMSILDASGWIPSKEAFEQRPAETPAPLEAFSRLPTPFLVTIGLAAIIWCGGANLVLIRQRRKAGRSWWESLNPLNPPFREMDGKAWIQIALLAILAFAVVSVGVDLAEVTRPDATASPPKN